MPGRPRPLGRSSLVALHHHMRIGAAHAKGAHGAAPRPLTPRPGLALFVDVERALFPGNVVAVLLAMQARRDQLVTHGLDKPNEAHKPRRRKSMADIGFGRG